MTKTTLTQPRAATGRSAGSRAHRLSFGGADRGSGPTVCLDGTPVCGSERGIWGVAR